MRCRGQGRDRKLRQSVGVATRRGTLPAAGWHTGWLWLSWKCSNPPNSQGKFVLGVLPVRHRSEVTPLVHQCVILALEAPSRPRWQNRRKPRPVSLARPPTSNRNLSSSKRSPCSFHFPPPSPSTPGPNSGRPTSNNSSTRAACLGARSVGFAPSQQGLLTREDGVGFAEWAIGSLSSADVGRCRAKDC